MIDQEDIEYASSEVLTEPGQNRIAIVLRQAKETLLRRDSVLFQGTQFRSIKSRRI